MPQSRLDKFTYELTRASMGRPTSKPVPICKIAQETGDVPMDCIFPVPGCQRHCREEHQRKEANARASKEFRDA